jgi:hypothetical protein
VLAASPATRTCGPVEHATIAHAMADQPINKPTDELPLDFPLPQLDSLGSLLNFGFKLFFQNIAPISALMATVWVPVELASEFLIYSSGQAENVLLIIKVGMWLEAIFGSWLIPAFIFLLWTRLRTGATPSIGSSLRFGGSLWASTFWVRMVSGFPILLGLLLLIVPGVIAWAMLALVEIVIAVEGLTGVSTTFSRSAQLTKGIRARLVAAGCIYFIFLGGVLTFSTLPSFVVDHWLINVVMNVVFSIFGILITCILFVAYLDRRRTEMQLSSAVGAGS